ncbi:MAG: hypothetical protein ND866_18975 [Pyrinomonadaceae bacterium]|nr:hypothetical protein [Pyrinomonadaceae bacterium]
MRMNHSPQESGSPKTEASPGDDARELSGYPAIAAYDEAMRSEGATTSIWAMLKSGDYGKAFEAAKHHPDVVAEIERYVAARTQPQEK